MFVPYVPIINNTDDINEMNENIVYSDTVLSLKDLGNNLKISVASKVNEYSLDRCLNTIIKSNPHVVFNTIQYSRKEEKVYFYTNEEISLKAWENSNIQTFKPLSNSLEILEEIKKILISSPNIDSDYISLYGIAELMKKKNDEYKQDKKSFEDSLEKSINNKYFDSSRIIIYDFDYENNYLKIGFKYTSYNDYEMITFAKRNNDLYILKDESYCGNDILVAFGDYLSMIYDRFMCYKDFKKEHRYNIKSVNSNFLVDIDCYGVSIFVNTSLNYFNHEFDLHSPSFKDDYVYKCNSNNVLSLLKGKEEELFKRVFVRIQDVPIWCQPLLYEERQQQLNEEQKSLLEDKSKIRTSIRKIFSFK